jgi:hypothetical protein
MRCSRCYLEHVGKKVVNARWLLPRDDFAISHFQGSFGKLAGAMSQMGRCCRKRLVIFGAA